MAAPMVKINDNVKISLFMFHILDRNFSISTLQCKFINPTIKITNVPIKHPAKK
jgi:hypothetical protein